MTRQSQALTGALLLVGGAVLGWAVSRGSADASDTDGLAADVAELRQVVQAQAERVARLENTLSPPGSERGSTAAGGPELVGRKGHAREAAAPPAGSVDDGRRVLADLEANVDGSRVVAIRAALQDLVRVGDPIVPDIAAALDSGREKRYIDRKLMRQHVRGYVSLRMVLMNALREIGTPAAKKALLASVAHSQNLRDYRDLVHDYLDSTDTPFVESIAALVPDMLRRLAEVGIAKDDYEAEELALYLAAWIRKHELTNALDGVEAVLLKTTPGGYLGYGALFRVLVRFAPERAAQVVLVLDKRDPKRDSLRLPGTSLSQIPRAQLALFYGYLIAREAEPNGRSALYHRVPGGVLTSIEDPAERVADARALVSFLEGRLAAETENSPKYALKQKLESLRRSIEAVK